ncbi:MAG TPA: ATP-binding protein [Terriglobia bacterium]|nr:ATP-binding protein [Terriglobia bacterium]
MTTKARQSQRIKLYTAVGFLLLLAMLVFAQQAFDLRFIPHSSLTPNQLLLLYALSTLIFVVLLVFGFILLRTLVKVWVERKQGKPGSRFKSSLLAMLVLLTLVPAVSVFAYAYGLANRSIDKWLSAPVDQIFENNQRIESLVVRQHQEHAQSVLDHLAIHVPSDFDETRKLFRLKALVLLTEAGQLEKASVDTTVDAETISQVTASSIAKTARAGESLDGDWLTARVVETPGGRKILAAVFPAPRDLETFSAEIAKQKDAYDQLKSEKNAFRNIYGTVLLLMTVLVLFSAVWLGLFLSKKITEPIEALTAATREISAGNLAYRVDVQAGDELGMLVSTFNGMASRLQGTTAELETRRRYMEIVLESIPTGVIALDVDFRIHTLNRAARTMFSVTMPTHLGDVFKGDDLKEIQAILADATEAGITHEISFRTPGRPANSAVTASRLSAGGFVLVVEDLTEVVRAQRASAWRDVARRLAHEIRNPLTPIQLSAERISRNISRLPVASPRVTTVIQECVGAISDEVASLKHLVEEFVRFARLPTVSRVPHPMKDLVDRTLALYEGRMEGVSLLVEVPEDLPLILMDSMQMRRVLINLIDNALEALSTQSERELRIRCELARDGTMARLTVEDSGAGIADEDRERLFTPYFSTRKNGTGLGLSIASRIVADHGGYIGVESNVPRGTRFVIELPVCQESSLSTTSPVSGSR